MSGESNLERRQDQGRQTKKAQKQGGIFKEETNPCLKEYQLSFKCMNDNNYEENKCNIYFDNYKNCKQFWLSVQIERRRKGIWPELPPVAEREKIKEEYIKTLK